MSFHDGAGGSLMYQGFRAIFRSYSERDEVPRWRPLGLSDRVLALVSQELRAGFARSCAERDEVSRWRPPGL